MSIKWVLPGWLADPTNCLPPPTPSFSTWTNRKEGFVQAGPHQTCWRWAFTSSSTPGGEAEEKKGRDGKRGDWFAFQGTPLSSGQTTDEVQWERKQCVIDAQRHSHTPTRAPSLIITQPAPGDKMPTKPGPLTVLDRGQDTPKVFHLDIFLSLSSWTYVCFPLA